MASGLPTYSERVAVSALDRGHDLETPSQASCYQRLESELRQATVAALNAGSRRLLAAYLQALLAYPDAFIRDESVVDPVTGSVIAHAPALPEGRLYPKERALVDLAVQERARGRRLLVYVTHTERRDLSPRLQSVLEQAGLTVAILKSDTVAADRREEWLAARVGEGADVLLCHPRLVQTGLDLVDWPSICWYQVDFSVYVMRQASRRSWRIGQRQPVEVTHLAYKGMLQAEALALVAAKMRSALMIEGELTEDGLAALGGDGQDMLLALARRLTEERADDEQSLEALFARRRDAEAECDDYLAAAAWSAGTASPELTSEWSRMLAPEACAPFEVVPSDGIAADSTAASTASSGLCFADLGRLIRRPGSRRKAPVEAQLKLFDG